MNRLMCFVTASFALFIVGGQEVFAEEFPLQLRGTVVAVDSGDELTVIDRGRRIRIKLDATVAPAEDENFAGASRNALSDLVLGREVAVQCVAGDRLRGYVGRVSLDDQSINKQMVELGWAWFDDREIKSPAMLAAMNAAREAKLGLWSGANAVPPWERPDPTAADLERDAVRKQAEKFLAAVHGGNVPRMKDYMSEKAREAIPNEKLKPPGFLRQQEFTIADVIVDGSTADVIVEIQPENEKPADPEESNPAPSDNEGVEPPESEPDGSPAQAGQLVFTQFEEQWLVTAVLLPQENSDELWAFDFEDPTADVNTLAARLQDRLDSMAANAEGGANAGQPDEEMAAPAPESVAANTNPPSSPTDATPEASGDSSPVESPMDDGSDPPMGDSPSAEEAKPVDVDPEKLAAARKQFESDLKNMDREAELYVAVVEAGPESTLLKNARDPRPGHAKRCWKVAEQYRGTTLALDALIAACRTCESAENVEHVANAAKRLLADHGTDPGLVTAAAYLARSAGYDPTPFFKQLMAESTPAELRAAGGCFWAKYLVNRDAVGAQQEELAAILNDAKNNFPELETPDGKLGEVADSVLAKLTGEAKETTAADAESESAGRNNP